MRSPRWRSWGTAAVEFAFVFPIFFMLVYGVIVYSYIFILHESINYAAQEAVAAAIGMDPRQSDTAEFDAGARSRARATAGAVLSWLPESQRARVLGADGQNVKCEIIGVETTAGKTVDAFEVTVTLSLKQPTPIFPIIDLPLVGEVPRLPDEIRARAAALI